jgi:sugar (pentulose or hexulose) kinase
MENIEKNKNDIQDGNVFLGIEFGSTRIKSVLINCQNETIANSSFTWENSFDNGLWTYPIKQIDLGLQQCYSSLKEDVKNRYGISLKKFKAGGISAMMHGYLPFDKNDELLVPFRTWRNTTTQEASETLSSLFGFPIPQRWSISHLYQSILNNEEHIQKINFITTLAGYIHWRLTGEKVLGTGDASGMFPIIKEKNSESTYVKDYISKFNNLIQTRNLPWKIESILPKILDAGKSAGFLSKEGALFLDPTGETESNIPFCPPEGDAGTGMTATNSVEIKTGNISAGTSIFSMVVLENNLKKSYPGIIDIVTTPEGYPTAMVHANNCTGEHNYWINLFDEVLKEFGHEEDKGKLFDKLISKSLEADKDCGKLMVFNYLSGETITGFDSGRPLFVRGENATFSLSNFMRAQMFSSICALRKGMDILFENEKISIKEMTGAGGYFKTEAGLKYMAAAMHTPISAMETAGEGGPWGMAILASYMNYKSSDKKDTLGTYLDKFVFQTCKKTTEKPDKSLVESFNLFYQNYINALSIEKAAVENF